MPPNSATALTAAARTASRFFKEPSSLHRARPPAPAPIVPERALRNWHAIGRYVTVRPTLAEQWSTLRSQVERDAACPVPELDQALAGGSSPHSSSIRRSSATTWLACTSSTASRARRRPELWWPTALARRWPHPPH